MKQRRMACLLVGALTVAAVLTACSSSSATHELQRALPSLLHDFGPDAKVARLDVSDDSVDVDLVSSDGKLHRRHYICGIHSCPSKGTDDPVTTATASQRKDAQVHLSDISPDVVDRMFAQLKLPERDSSAKLKGSTWTIRSGARVLDEWQAYFDGGDIHQTQSRDTAPGGPSFSVSVPPIVIPTAIASSLPSQTLALLKCINAAHGNVAAITACTQRYPATP